MSLKENVNITFRQMMAGFEKALILNALEEAKGNQTLAARRLDISRGKLRYKLKEYGNENAQTKVNEDSESK